LTVSPLVPEGCVLLRVTPQDRRFAAAAQQAMRAAGSAADVQRRLDAGDELVGWDQGGDIAGFGWLSYRPRVLAASLAAARPERAFPYHFHTMPRARGRHLYPALLMQARYVAGVAGSSELVVDVQASNAASRRGLEKAGFTPVERVTVRTFLGRFEHEWERTICGQRTAAHPIW
jgi:Acetyltransferase (GNAT) family